MIMVADCCSHLSILILLFELILRDLIDMNVNHCDSKICIIGDMNARTGTLPDLLETDEHLFKAVGLDDCHNELFIDETTLYNLGIATNRHNEDKVTDENGRKLIDLCINTGNLIVNGRTGRREKTGRATCKGVSTIDYVLASPDLFHYINNFSVDIFDKCLSDVHSPLSLELNTIENHQVEINSPTNTPNSNGTGQSKEQTSKLRVKWDQSKLLQFRGAFETDRIQSVMRRVDDLHACSAPTTQAQIDGITDHIEQVYKEVGERAGVIKVLPAYQDGKPRAKKQPRKSENKPWFNEECSEKRKEFYQAKNNYKTKVCTANKEIMNQKSKIYRQSMKAAYKEYHNDLQKTLRNLKSSDPKEYWKIINSAAGSNTKIGNITIDSFMDHFKNLNKADTTATTQSPETNPTNPTNHAEDPIEGEDDLPFNQPVTVFEIRKAVKKLKNGKAAGIDQILNEFIKHSPEDMLKLICSYFNLILDTGIVPDSWTVGLIVPIFKNKGDINNPDNYRGITLLSCIGKLFTMLINSRLQSYLDENTLLGEEQAGFRGGYSTLDHIFSLHCIIDLFLSQKKRLYCAFVDYRKAFDMIYRSSLWQKLLKLNIKGKVLNVIINAYNGAKSCIKLNRSTSDYFSCNIGVRQGENLSPLLFAIYLNDLETHFVGNCNGINCTTNNDETEVYIKLFTLLYADDTILLSESAADLQSMLHILHNYCQKWQLTVNTDKTKIVVFSRGKIRNLPQISYGDETIEVVSSYNYLGILFNYDGKFGRSIKKQISQAKRALFALLSKARKLQLPLDLICHLFDACISPILLYGCEVWGYSNLEAVERVHSYFCKYILHLSPKTSNSMALGELGRSRMACTIKQRMVNFWSRLSTGKPSKISVTLLHLLKEKKTTGLANFPWYTEIANTINNCGLAFLLETPSEHLDPRNVKAVLRDRVSAIECQDWHSAVTDSGACSTYKTFKSHLRFEKYLTVLSRREATALCRYRCGNHKLPIITGRYNKVEKSERVCPLCNTKAIGDEHHYLFTCTAFIHERSKYINTRYLEPPGAQDIEGLFTCENPTSLSNLSQFCSIIMNSFKNNETSKKAKKVKKNKTKADDHGIIVINKTRKTTQPSRECKNTKAKAPSDKGKVTNSCKKQPKKTNNNNNNKKQKTKKKQTNKQTNKQEKQTN